MTAPKDKEERDERLIREDHSNANQIILAVVGSRGAVHYWHHLTNSSVGGVEMHSRTPLVWSRGGPDNETCWLLKAPCWHDGSSLYAAEVMTPLWARCKASGDMEPFWLKLESVYRDKFPAPAPKE